jgi:ribonuclease HII
VADSKLLSPKRRQALFAVISAAAIAIGIGQADVDEVDRINFYWAASKPAGARSKIRQLFRRACWSTGSAGSRVVALCKRQSSRMMAGGNKTRAAQTLGVSRKHLYAKIAKYDLAVD